jgi:hypothetical protein
MHGGKRSGSGRKSDWIRGKTTVIRVPEVLVDEVLRLARLVDQGKPVDDVTKSRYIDLSGISIRQEKGRSFIFLDDLMRAGFKVRPLDLADRLRKDMDRLR